MGDLANRYTLVAGENDEYKQNLMEMFPDEKPAIEKYIKITEEAMASFRGSGLLKTLPLFVTRFLVRTGLYRLLDHGYHRFASKSVQQGLEELTDNKDLQAVLAANFLCYGTDPTRAPFLLQAAMSTGYSKGAYYPRGGPSMIPRKIIKNIMAHGGKVLTKAPVAQILIDPDAKAVTGVELENGDIVKANTVVSDVGLINTATKLLPPGTINLEFAKDASASFGKLHPSVTGVNLFVGLKGDPEVLHLPTGIQWIYPSNDVNGAIDRLRNLEVDQAMNLDPVELPLFVSIPCTTDSAWNETYPEKSVLEIIMPTPWRWFEKFSHEFNPTMQSHGPEYEEVKTTFAKKMWERVSASLSRDNVHYFTIICFPQLAPSFALVTVAGYSGIEPCWGSASHRTC